MIVHQNELKIYISECRCECGGNLALSGKEERHETVNTSFSHSPIQTTKTIYTYRCTKCGDVFTTDRYIKLRSVYLKSDDGREFELPESFDDAIADEEGW